MVGKVLTNQQLREWCCIIVSMEKRQFNIKYCAIDIHWVKLKVTIGAKTSKKLNP